MLTIYSNGITLGLPPSLSNHKRAIRGDNTGWSESSTRANTTFLYSVDSKKLTGYGYAFTFTLRDLPETPKHWYGIRDKFMKRMNRMGLIRYHWVTEWQRRGVPHLHGCLYFENEMDHSAIKTIKRYWCECVGKYGALQKAQDIKPIESAIGWLQYLAKHGARSKYHYQRSAKPESWKSSGRVWGKGGEWETRQTFADTTIEQFHRIRRIARNWRIAKSRDLIPIVMLDGQGKGTTIYPDSQFYREIAPNGVRSAQRIKSARNALKCPDRSKSTVRGISEWIPEHCAYRILEFVSLPNQMNGNSEKINQPTG